MQNELTGSVLPQAVSASDTTLGSAPPSPGESAGLVRAFLEASEGGIASREFEVVEEVGRGGMGVVYRAVQKTLRRDVAIKVLLGGGDSREAAADFAAEALITGALEHPSIPPVYGFDPGAEGRPFLAMKLVRGFSWAELLEPETDAARAAGAAMDLRRHLAILRRVCEAVGFAHSRGIIHRDLKPANVMVGEFGEVLVMDWGIALDLRGLDGEPRPPRTLVGSPAYMPPEMALLRTGDVGPWTDVYLLGAILYKLITGRAPHDLPTMTQALRSAARGRIEAPDKTADGKPIDPALAAIAMRALDPEPMRRYPTAMAFAAALDEHERRVAALALAEFGRAEVEATLKDARAGSATPAAVYARLSGALAALVRADAECGGDPAIRERLGGARVAFAEVAVRNGDLALAESQLEAAGPDAPGAAEARAELDALRTRLAAERRRRRALVAGLGFAALVAAGLWLWQAGRSRELEAARERREAAQKELEAASWGEYDAKVAAARKATEIDPSWPDAWSALGRAYYAGIEGAPRSAKVDPAPVIRAFELAEGAFARAVEAGAATAQPLNELAYCAAMLGDWKTAGEHYRRCAALADGSHEALESAGLIALAEGRAGEAVEHFTACIKLDPQEMDFCNRAVARFAAGDLDGALEDARKAESFAPHDEWYPTLVVAALLARGDLREAGRKLAACLALHDEAPHGLGLFALRAALLGEADRARAALERARAAQARYARASLGVDPWFRATARAPAPHDRVGKAILLDLDLEAIARAAPPSPARRHRLEAEALLGRGDFPGAIAAATRALSEDPADGGALLARGRALLALGHGEAARDDLALADVLAPERAAEVRAAREGAR